jgi:probable poly-beta-1,6-N-acetyl-D-glucosamine export protein
LKEDFLDYLHHFRGFAIILIVGVHCRTAIPWQENSLTHEVLFYGLNSSTILFVFISGFLFHHLNAEGFHYKSYLTRKIKFVIIPYVLVSIPAIVDKLVFETDGVWMTDTYKSSGTVFRVLYLLTTGKHSGPFYFIPMISLIYLMAPVLYAFQKTKAFPFVAMGVSLVGLFSHHYGYYASLGESFVYFLPVYIFGMWISAVRDAILTAPLRIFLLMACLYLTLLSLEVSHVIESLRLDNFGAIHYWQPAVNWGKLKEQLLALLLLKLFYHFRTRSMPTPLGKL